MGLDPGACYRALQTRDARFDGRFFVVVRTTGIFCRPICPAPTPRRENCAFVPSAAAAREAGFRPCLRCRPEAAPGSAAWRGTSVTVSRAMQLIEAGALDGADQADLAGRLGVGERHLRRLFERHVGAPPGAVARTRRILFAKRLVDETDRPMVEIAHAAGFSSVRRFNEAVREAYGEPPRILRRRRRRLGTRQGGLRLRLPYRPPFAWHDLLGFLAAHAIPGVEDVTDGVYARTLRVGAAEGRLGVRHDPTRREIDAEIRLDAPAPLLSVAERLRRLFDLRADPTEIDAHLGSDDRLGTDIDARPGLRVPGSFEPFEVAVRGVLGQQVSVAAANRLAGRLAERFGDPLRTPAAVDAPAGLARHFPSPERLTDADIATIGLPAARARAIRSLARAVASGDLALDGGDDPAETLGALEALPGIGPWSAGLIAMRALGDPDAFIESDLGVRKVLGNGLGPARAREALEHAEAWRPWRAYAVMHLWSVFLDGDARTTPARTPSRTRSSRLRPNPAE